jgi:hypothetical protein
LKNIYELYVSKSNTGSGDEGEDAMFSKKPLGGFSCASCEKSIKLQPNPAEYHPWGKFPFRDPNERIAKVENV